MKKEIKELIIGIVVILIVILIGFYIGFKIFNLVKYNIPSISDKEYFEMKKSLVINNTITIDTNIKDNDKYIFSNNVSIRNDFENFIPIEVANDTENITRLGLFENDKLKASIWFGGSTDSIVDSLINYDLTTYGTLLTEFNLEKEEIKQILEKYNITNDIELFKFLGNYEYKSSNIFNSLTKIKENYFVKYINSMLLYLGKNITLIEGDYEGYIINTNDTKSVYLIVDDKKYAFIFINIDYFNDTYIKELLDTVVIDKNNK